MGVESKRRVEEDADEVLSASSAGSGSETGSGSEASDDGGSNKRRKLSRRSLSPEADVWTALPRRGDLRGASLLKSTQPSSATSQKAAVAKASAPVDNASTFDALNVRPWLVQSLSNMAIHRPTGIQKGCIPEILKGRDCIGGSRTGSGKTVAFAVPILQTWADDPLATFALVLTPTR